MTCTTLTLIGGSDVPNLGQSQIFDNDYLLCSGKKLNIPKPVNFQPSRRSSHPKILHIRLAGDGFIMTG